MNEHPEDKYLAAECVKYPRQFIIDSKEIILWNKKHHRGECNCEYLIITSMRVFKKIVIEVLNSLLLPMTLKRVGN